ncbi:MAG: response regulator [Rubripirellula sp.]
MNLKVLIVDDHEVARIGLSTLLTGSGFSVVGSVATCSEAIESLDRSIDVILLDVRMPNQDGLSTLQKIRDIDIAVPVVILSAYDNPTYIARAAALGANDYLLKGGLPESIGKSLACVTNGALPPPESRLTTIRRIMREQVNTKTLPKELPLTSREAQVLRHVGLGLSNKEIARSLEISVETVKEHVQNVLRKIGAKDRTAAAVKAIKLGLVE